MQSYEPEPSRNSSVAENLVICPAKFILKMLFQPRYRPDFLETWSSSARASKRIENLRQKWFENQHVSDQP